MEPSNCVLLYSKYSSASKILIDGMKSSGVNFASVSKLQMLCVDNEDVRTRILQNEKIVISSVPCLLVIYDNGKIEKYDDSFVFKWVEEIVSKFRPEPKKAAEVAAVVEKIAVEEPTSIDDLQSEEPKKFTSIDDLQSEEEEEEEKEEENDRYRTKKLPPIIKKQAQATDAKSKKSSDIMSKAKELAKGRPVDPPPPGHPAQKFL